MRKLSERFLLRERKFPDAEDIQATCIPISLRSMSEQGDSTAAKGQSPRCRFSPCPEMTSPIPSQTLLATSLRGRSTSIEDYIGRESIPPSTRHPLSRD